MSMRHRRASWLSALCLAAAVVLTATPGAVAQSPTRDTLQVTGSAPGFPNIGINAEQTGEDVNATGLAFLQPSVGAIMTGRVTCLEVTGPGRGIGTPDAPTTAVVEFFDIRFGVVTVKVIDNGGTVTNSDTDLFATALGPACSTENPDLPPFVPFHGFMEAFDAPPPAPTSKEQCKDGGWRAFGELFTSQGQCVAFVQRGPKPH
jgi:hypothetical protein